MTKNEFLELLDHGLTQAAEAHLHGAQVVLNSLTGDYAGNF
jgi:hypothetical protein